jgi:hypothetical protein
MKSSNEAAPADGHDPNGGVADSLDEAKAAFRGGGAAPGREPVSVRFREKKQTRNAQVEPFC